MAAIDATLQPTTRTDRWLLAAAALFTLAVLVHNADHVRRGADSVNTDVFWAGTSAIAVEIGLVVLAAQRHRLAPLTAAAGGIGLAAGYILVHFMPARGWLSDSLTSSTEVSLLTFGAASLEVLAAITLGLVGLIIFRERGGFAGVKRPSPGEHSLRDAIRHPITMAMTLGNAVVLAISFSQL